MIFIGLACITRMWVNAQRDGRRAEYRSRALCSTPQSLADAPTTVPCSNAAKTRNPLTLGGVPQITEPISAVIGPKFTML